MSDQIIMEHLRASLKPQGTAPIVRIGFHDSGAGGAFYNADFVSRTLDEMERRIIANNALGEVFSPLEKLAVELLMSSAYIGRPEDVQDLIKRKSK